MKEFLINKCITTDLPLDSVSSSLSLEVRRLMSRLPVLIHANVMLI